MKATVIGAGLAGCEAAWQLASRGVHVTLHEMKPDCYTPAHHSAGFAELVCSNSLRSDLLTRVQGSNLWKAKTFGKTETLPAFVKDALKEFDAFC